MAQNNQLTDDQIRLYLHEFKKVDTNSDGFISRDELYILLDDVKLVNDPDLLVAALKQLKMDKDLINKTEVLQLCKFLLNRKVKKQADIQDSGNFNSLFFSAANITNRVVNWLAPEPQAESAFFKNDQSKIPLHRQQSMMKQNAAAAAKSGNSIADPPNRRKSYVAEVVVEMDGSSDSIDEDSDYEYYSYSEGEQETLIDSANAKSNDQRRKSVQSGSQLRRPSVQPNAGVQIQQSSIVEENSDDDDDDKSEKDLRLSQQSHPPQQKNSSSLPSKNAYEEDKIVVQKSAPIDSTVVSVSQRGSVSEQERAAKVERERQRREKENYGAIKGRGRSKYQRVQNQGQIGYVGQPGIRHRDGAGFRPNYAIAQKSAVNPYMPQPYAQQKNMKGAAGNATTALRDPKVRKQLAGIKTYRPYFLQLVTIIQVLVMAYEIYFNSGFAPVTDNPFLGPSSLSLIQMGGKYGPCMRNQIGSTNDFYTSCARGYPSTSPRAQNGSCLYFDNLNYICGLGGFVNKQQPDQAFRFFTPMFLHTGLLHLAFNLIIQTRTGFEMEKQLGSFRMALIYVISGVGGNLVAAILNPNSVTVGANGAMYGIFALLYLDLVQNWPILVNPYKNLLILSVTVVIALTIGLLPFIDNYAHIGGFLSGTLAGLIFMPKITFGTWDRRRKLLLTLVSFPILAMLLFLGFYQFYTDPSFKCSWCVWLDCVPPTANWCK
ncbi:hypothetical protein MP228_007950 [Amoeboaphelidium protococcarum]|nr:hypothetical protein MP228_007950 [Amoeboaphelidium protococcarum]